jgi:protein-S-isoprenylcysteine O-methyltransferase Ste14
MQILAWVTYLLFLAYVANFLMLSAVAAKEAGRSIWLFDRGERFQRWTGWAFRLAFLGAVLWPPLRLWTGGFRADPVADLLEGSTASLAGHLFVAIGAAVALVAQYHMGAAWRIGAREGEQGELVQTGPFALSRNPVFVGQAILFAGLFLAFPDLIQLAISAAVIAAARLQVGIEERVLEGTFGAAYRDYAARVPRWTGRVRSPASQSANLPASETHGD